MHTNRVAAWRARRKESESDESRRTRLEKECHANSIQRQKRNLSESPTRRISRLKHEGVGKANHRV